jgi:hypothetical protein
MALRSVIGCNLPLSGSPSFLARGGPGVLLQLLQSRSFGDRCGL